MSKKQVNNPRIAPLDEWAFSEELDIPKELAPEICKLRQIIDSCKLRPRDCRVAFKISEGVR